MTINLFGVRNALTAEDAEYQELKRKREKALKRWRTEKEVIEGANNAHESSLPQEAQKSSSPA